MSFGWYLFLVLFVSYWGCIAGYCVNMWHENEDLNIGE